MNSIPEFLNALGTQLTPLAAGWFLQVSVLIGVLGLVEFLAGSRLRPAVRHALWLLVPIKLLLPPSVALPTGIGYWWSSGKTQSITGMGHYFEIRFSDAVSRSHPSGDSTESSGHIRVGSGLQTPGFVALIWLLGSAGFVAILARRTVHWRALARTSSAVDPDRDAALDRLVAETHERLGIQHPVALRLIRDGHSPALCGGWNPIILLPRSLAANLAPNQIRAILAHELVHARRGDLWINAIQTLLQIVWWWHPLVWFANARLRAAREETVDDTVLSEIGPDADVYPDTLLAVARSMMAPRLPGLGFVGILETKSTLRTRIERMVHDDFIARPRLGFGGWTGIVLGALLLLPMARPSHSADAPNVSPSQSRIDTNDGIATGLRLEHVAASAAFANAAMRAKELGITNATPETEGAAASLLAIQRRRSALGSAGPFTIDLDDEVLFGRKAWDKSFSTPTSTSPAFTTAQASPSSPKSEPQILIESRFLELNESDFKSLGLDADPTASPGSKPDKSDGRVVDGTQWSEFRKAIAQRKTIRELAAPRILTLSGRAASITTSPDSKANEAKSSCGIEVQPVLEPDGRSIRLEAIGKVTTSLGTDEIAKSLIIPKPDEPTATGDAPENPSPGTTVAVNAIGYINRQFTHTAVLRDGQLLILGDLNAPPSPQLKLPRAIIVVKTTLVDSTGNPIAVTKP